MALPKDDGTVETTDIRRGSVDALPQANVARFQFGVGEPTVASDRTASTSSPKVVREGQASEVMYA
jgi:hypothetical protein